MATLKKVILTADRTTFNVGESALLTASPQDASKRAVAAPVTFGLSDPTKGTLTNAGTRKAEVRGDAAGYLTVDATASLNGVKVTGSLRLTIKAAPPAPPVVARVDVTLSPATAKEGDTVTATATPRDASGSPVTNRAVTWTTADPACATVDATGHVTACAASTVAIRATVDGIAGSAALTITAPVVVVAGAGIDLLLHRWDAGTARGASFDCLPLRPGQLTAERIAAGYGVLRIDGAEVPVFLKAPPGPRQRFSLTGDLRGVWCYTEADGTNGAPRRATFDPAAKRTLPMRPEPPHQTAYTTLPHTILPTRAVDLCDAGLIDDVRPLAELPADALTAGCVRFWETWEPVIGANFPGILSEQADYERVATYLEWWHATARPAYYQRAREQWAQMRGAYHVPNNFGPAEWYLSARTYRLAALFFGDDLARTQGISQFAAVTAVATYNPHERLGAAETYGGSRFVYAPVLGYLDALGFGQTYAWDAVRDDLALAPQVPYVIGRLVNDPAFPLPTDAVPMWGPLDGVPAHRVNFGKPTAFGGLECYAFHAALILQPLWHYHRHVMADVRIVARARQFADFLWTKARALKAADWIGERFVLEYPNDMSPAPELNAITADTFLELACALSPSEGRVYRERAEQLLLPCTTGRHGGNEAPYLDGPANTSKQWTESMFRLLPCLVKRARAIAAGA